METVALSIPSDALARIRAVADARDMSPEALMRLYIGHGLREDEARRYQESEMDFAREEIKAAWTGEIERWVAALESGEDQPIPGEQVFEELEQLYR